MKMEFNKGITRACIDISEKIFYTLKFLDKDDKVNCIDALEKEIDETLVQ